MQQALLKSWFPSFSHPFNNGKAALRPPCNLLQDDKASSSKERCFSPLIISVAILWNLSMAFLCWGPQSWVQYSRWGLTTAEGLNPLSQPADHTAFGAAQGKTGLLSWKHTWLAHPPALPKSISAGLFSIPSTPSCIDSMGCFNTGAQHTLHFPC